MAFLFRTPLAEQQRNTQKVFLLHAQSDQRELTWSSSPPRSWGPGSAPSSSSHGPLSAIAPLRTAQAPCCPTAEQGRPRPRSPNKHEEGHVPRRVSRDHGLTRRSSPKAGSLRPRAPSHYPELQATTCKISLVHVTFPLGWFQNPGFNPLEFLKTAAPPQAQPWEEIPRRS